MTTFHAVLWIDHSQAQIVQFDSEHVEVNKLRPHTHHTKKRGNGVRTEHEFFGEVCDALVGIAEVLVVGPSTGLKDFQHYAEKHRRAITAQLVGYETMDHVTENQLVAKARQYFTKYDRMAGIPTPS